MKNLKIKVSLKDYSLETIRYAAYVFSKDFYVQLGPVLKGKVEVVFEPKNKNADIKTVSSSFKRELKDELLRSKIFKANSGLREHLLMRSMAYQEKMGGPEDLKGLTPEQEKELEELIQQVEDEIKKELKNTRESNDPLEIKKTWEEKYGDKIREKLSKKINEE